LLTSLIHEAGTWQIFRTLKAAERVAHETMRRALWVCAALSPDHKGKGKQQNPKQAVDRESPGLGVATTATRDSLAAGASV